MNLGHKFLLGLFVIGGLYLSSIFTSFRPQKTMDSSPTYHETFRPGYHFSPPKNWMNDPNGLIFYDGLYHMYYQYNPYDIVWGHMSWGHAVSTDLIYWKNLPVAIPEYDGVQIFSGCNIIDVNNTSGFCKSKELPCLLAFYTAQTAQGQAQAVAYSNDFGLSYTQHSGNPIIDEHLQDHRDPKVFWYEPDRKWIMITALSAIFKCRLYSSTDLIHWTHLSDFGTEGSTEGIWEDPDLFHLLDEKGNVKWVLTHAVNVAKVEYYIGDFDGQNFVNTETRDEILFFDYGRDFSEAATWTNDPKGRRLIVAWLDEGYYGGQLPTQAWRGQLTLIRELKLKRYPEGLRVVSEPIEEYSKLRSSEIRYRNVSLNHTQNNLTIPNTGNQLEISAVFTLPNDTSLLPTEFGFQIFVGPNQKTTIGYNVENQILFTDRTQSGLTDFSPVFSDITKTALSPENNQIQLRLFIDQSSVEVFANHGKIAMSNLIYPDPDKNQILAYVIGGEVEITSLDRWLLNSIWKNATLGFIPK